MSLIACTAPCVYQKEGCCTLSRAASAGMPGLEGCVNFVPAGGEPLQQSGHGLPDVAHLDDL